MLQFSVLVFDFFTLSNPSVTRKSGVNTGATDLAEENTSLFDYVHDNNFCLVVCLLVLFFGMLVIKYCCCYFFLNKTLLQPWRSIFFTPDV